MVGYGPPALLIFPPSSPVEAAQTLPCLSVYGVALPLTMRMVPAGKTVRFICSVTVESALLVAVTVAVVTEATLVGGVYRPPAVSVPTVGFIDQVTPMLGVPCTQALNCWAGAPTWIYFWWT